MSFADAPQVRRFRLRHLRHAKTGDISLEALLERLNEAAADVDMASSFVYQDEDGDSVAVTTDRELLDAIHSSMDTGCPLKLVAVASKKGLDHCTQAQGTLLTDPGVTNRIRAIMNTRDLDPVLYKSNLVDAANKLVLTHLVDEFQSHFTSEFAPPMTAISSTAFRCEYGFTYSINGTSHLSKYFAIDGIYLDLTQECEQADIRLLIPRPVYDTLDSQVLEDELIYGHTVTTDELQESSAFIDKENPPAFVVFQEHLDGEGNTTGGMIARDEGLLTDAMALEDHKHLYKITGIFTYVRVLPPGEETVWHSQLHLVGLRVFSIHDNILKKNKLTNATAFGK